MIASQLLSRVLGNSVSAEIFSALTSNSSGCYCRMSATRAIALRYEFNQVLAI